MKCFFCKKPEPVPLYVSLLEKQVRALRGQVVALEIQVQAKQSRIEGLESVLAESKDDS